MRITSLTEEKHDIYYETHAIITFLKKEIKLKKEDVRMLNDEIIPTADILIFGLDSKGKVYVSAYELSENEIDKEKFIEGVQKRIKKYVRIWKKQK
jgi:hypothetical protein